MFKLNDDYSTPLKPMTSTIKFELRKLKSRLTKEGTTKESQMIWKLSD